jgi:hypothetical protein
MSLPLPRLSIPQRLSNFPTRGSALRLVLYQSLIAGLCGEMAMPGHPKPSVKILIFGRSKS